MKVNYTQEEIKEEYKNEMEILFQKHIAGQSINKATSIDDIVFDIHALKGLGGNQGQYPCSIRGRYGRWHSVLPLSESKELLERAKQSFMPTNI